MLPQVSIDMRDFWTGFLKGAKETPRAYFAPLVAAWRLLLNTRLAFVQDWGGKRTQMIGITSTEYRRIFHESLRTYFRPMTWSYQIAKSAILEILKAVMR